MRAGLTKLQRRLNELGQLLPIAGPGQFKSVNLSPIERDKLKAYVVLCYAELEGFFEYLSHKLTGAVEECIPHFEMAAQQGKNVTRNVGRFGTAVFPKILRKSSTDVLLLVNGSRKKIIAERASIDEALTRIPGVIRHHRSVISANNGLNSADCEKLFDHIGFPTQAQHWQLINNLNTLTAKRGKLAHSGDAVMSPGVSAYWIPDPKSEFDLINSIDKAIPLFVDDLCTFCDY